MKRRIKTICAAVLTALCLCITGLAAETEAPASEEASAEVMAETETEAETESQSDAEEAEGESDVREQVLSEADPEEEAADENGLDGYELEKMVVFSRHNMRAPTKSSSTVLDQITPYEWTDYTAAYGELTLLGGLQETAMGQYFRQYLEDKGLIEANWIPEEGQVRFYANSYQRTLATARYFAAGMLPVANVDVEYHEEIGTMDSVFKPCLNFISDAYLEQVQEEMDALADGSGMQGLIDSYADSLALLEEVLDFQDSSYAEENDLTSIMMEETEITYELGEEPKAAGGLKIANSAADALVMQYYAQHDLTEAGFGQSLTWDQWQSIGSINTLYQHILFGLPSIAVNVAHPLLMELESELENDDRVFTYLCGHDSNVEPILVALGVEDYEIDDNLSTKTPIGCKLVWEKYRGSDGEEYARFCLVYQSSEKLRDNELVTLNDPPVWIELSFSGLEKNADGLYRWEDVMDRFDQAIAAFDELPEDEAEPAA